MEVDKEAEWSLIIKAQLFHHGQFGVSAEHALRRLAILILVRWNDEYHNVHEFAICDCYTFEQIG